MKVGKFIHQCMRTAGDPTGQTLSDELAFEYLTNAVTYCLRKFAVSSRTELTAQSGTEIALPGVRPKLVRVDGTTFVHVTGMDDRLLGGMEVWTDTPEGIRFGVTLVNAGIEIYGSLDSAAYTAADRAKELVEVVTDTETQAQWLPADVAQIARYRVQQAMAEELGAIDKAMYFERMAKAREVEAFATHRLSGATSVIAVNDL